MSTNAKVRVPLPGKLGQSGATGGGLGPVDMVVPSSPQNVQVLLAPHQHPHGTLGRWPIPVASEVLDDANCAALSKYSR